MNGYGSKVNDATVKTLVKNALVVSRSSRVFVPFNWLNVKGKHSVPCRC